MSGKLRLRLKFLYKFPVLGFIFEIAAIAMASNAGHTRNAQLNCYLLPWSETLAYILAAAGVVITIIHLIITIRQKQNLSFVIAASALLALNLFLALVTVFIANFCFTF